MLKRVLTSIVAIPLVLYFIYQGGWQLCIFSAGAIFIMATEYVHFMVGYDIIYYLAAGGGGAVLAFGAFFQSSMYYNLILAIVTLLFLAIVMFKEDIRSANRGLYAFIAIPYIGVLFSYIILIRQLPEGFIHTINIFILIWICDTAAYIVGIGIGKMKLSPAISPNKTVEGAVGGFIAGIIAFTLSNYIIFGEQTIYISILIGAIVSIVAQLGDLFESFLKRFANIKDSGTLLPGHGGVLDRFDSLLFALPVYYYLVKILLLGVIKI